MIAWINRMKELFCIDPVNDEIGREFFQQLLYYCLLYTSAFA